MFKKYNPYGKDSTLTTSYSTLIGETVNAGIELLLERGVHQSYIRSSFNMNYQEYTDLRNRMYSSFQRKHLDFYLARLRKEIRKL